MVAASAIAFIAGITTSGYLSGDKRGEFTQPSSSCITPSEQRQGERTDDGLPQGFGHSEAGAVAAATSYVQIGQHVMKLAPTRVPDAIRMVAAIGTADAQVIEAERQLHQLRDALSDGTGATMYAQAALASRLDSYNVDRARVSVWSVGVISRRGVARPQAGWTVSTFELVWERNDWKIWSESISPGPAPTLDNSVAASTSEQLDQALSGFELSTNRK